MKLTKRRAQLCGGEIKVPVVKTRFGLMLDLSKRIPADCDCVMVLVNSGGGLNAGVPKPVGFLKLPHQLYLDGLEELLIDQNATPIKWITVIPVRSKEYVDVWAADGLPANYQ